MRRLLFLAIAIAALAAPASSFASPYLRSGIQDDAWLQYGPGTLESRVAELDSLGVDVVRVTLDWRQIEPRKGVDSWSRADELLGALHKAGIAPLVTLYGTPAWANGGRSENWAPTSKWTFAGFARRAATRYPYVHLWTIWNEPNQRRWLRPTSPSVYTQRLLNTAYAAIHRLRRIRSAGGVTAPRASTGGVSPVDWIAGMKKAHARLDAYAHNPYPLRRGETPTAGGCDHCTTITMATLRLLRGAARVRHAHAHLADGVRLPDESAGPAARRLPCDRGALHGGRRAARVRSAARRHLVHYLVRDEPDPARWQSGLFTARGAAKPAAAAFKVPLAQKSRTGLRTTLWGQVRPGGRSTFRLQQFRSGAWHTVGAYTTSARGYFTRTVRAGEGARFRVFSPVARTYSPIVTVT